MDVLEFFAQNFSLSGLNNKTALFTICKELIDNAFDACKTKRGEIHRVSLKIQKCELEELIQVSCLDDGCGISCDSIEAIGEIFNSSKKLKETSGTFGLGLKTILMFASNSAKSSLSITMRVDPQTIWKFNIVLSEVNEPLVRNISREVIYYEKWPWSTSIYTEFRSFIPKNIFELLSSYINIISIYDPKTNYTLEIFDQTTQSIRNNLEPTSSKIVSLEKSIESLLLENVKIYSKYTLEDSNDENSISTTCFIGRTETTTSGIAIVHLVRCINGIPLPEHSYDSCIISKSMSTLLKSKLSEYGITRGIERTSVKNSSRMINPPGITRHHHYIRSIPVKPALDSTWNIMLLCINVSSKYIEYGDIKKTHITNDNVRVRLIDIVPKVIGVVKANLEVSGKPLELESIIETKRRQIDNYCQHISGAIAGIISKASKETVDKAQKLLNSDGDYADIKKEIKRLLRNI